MNSRYCLPLTVVLLLASSGYAQIDRIVIPAGTPEDQSIQEISKETDSQKKVVLYQDFLREVFVESRRRGLRQLADLAVRTRVAETFPRRLSSATRRWQRRRTTSTSWFHRRESRSS